MLMALAAVEIAAPMLGSYLGADLAIDYIGSGGYLLPALALLAIVALVGGLYPAFYLSRFEPARVLKANRSSAELEGSGRLRSGLVVTQFAISIGLIVCTAVVYSQTRFVQTMDPGYRQDGLIQIDGTWRFSEAGNADAVKAEMAAVAGVTGVARTNIGVAATNKSIQAVKLPGASDTIAMGAYGVDPNFFPVMGMRLLAGRMLGDRFANDRIDMPPAGGATPTGPSLAQRGANIVVNRNAARLLGFSPQQAVGKQVLVSIGGGDMVPSTIAGVVEDTRIRSARDEIEPLVFAYVPAGTSQFLIRYENAVPAEVLAGLQRVWARFLPEIPFEGAFAEDLVAELYEAERTRGTVFAAFSIMAVLISCLGLFGLAAFTTERRTKEIGIRKVLGAKVRDIVRLLTWQFSKPVIIANLIAWPVAWWAMRDWLNTFDARVDLGPGPFVVAGLLALGIAIGTVAGHAIKVARTNPIHALRYE
jgi:putative ABC transport system permease protein